MVRVRIRVSVRVSFSVITVEAEYRYFWCITVFAVTNGAVIRSTGSFRDVWLATEHFQKGALSGGFVSPASMTHDRPTMCRLQVRQL